MAIRAINSEEVNVANKVMGKYFMNAPIMPGQKISGVNTANVVAVEAMMGQAIRFAASLKAKRREAPSLILRSANSVTTMAPSTSIPTDKMSAKSTTMLRV